LFFDTRVSISNLPDGKLRLLGQSQPIASIDFPYEVLEVEFDTEVLPVDSLASLRSVLETRDIDQIAPRVLRLVDVLQAGASHSLQSPTTAEVATIIDEPHAKRQRVSLRCIANPVATAGSVHTSDRSYQHQQHHQHHTSSGALPNPTSPFACTVANHSPSLSSAPTSPFASSRSAMAFSPTSLPSSPTSRCSSASSTATAMSCSSSPTTANNRNVAAWNDLPSIRHGSSTQSLPSISHLASKLLAASGGMDFDQLSMTLPNPFDVPPQHFKPASPPLNSTPAFFEPLPLIASSAPTLR
jgi:hypothetical protein